MQLTGRRNYVKAGKLLGVDFVTNPALLLAPQYSITILVTGMREGWFTGRKLSHYITLQRSRFVEARKVVNGDDRANDFAVAAKRYNAMLKADGYGVEEFKPPIPDLPIDDDKPPVEPFAPEKQQTPAPALVVGLWRAIKLFLEGLF